ncbi:MAG: hypothetical protein GY820_31945 [Gammaproteobacteria bacterium]|nr:hypothetical protein [Gammaproteobacteria bacterium]
MIDNYDAQPRVACSTSDRGAPVPTPNQRSFVATKIKTNPTNTNNTAVADNAR